MRPWFTQQQWLFVRPWPDKPKTTAQAALLQKAQQLSGLTERGQLIRETLLALIPRESAARLAALGGSAPDLQPTRRRQSKRA